MKVRDVMTPDVRIANPSDMICDAAMVMAEIDAGIIPVADNNRLVGMLSDRDIAVRAIARGKGPETPVSEIMSKEVKYCFDDQELDEVCQNMAELKVRRLPVINRDKRLVGILSLGDIASYVDDFVQTGEALSRISEPGGAHSQEDGDKEANIQH
jgi:CBS domain-containing protein